MLRSLLGPECATLAHVAARVPGLSPVAALAARLVSAADALAAMLTQTPLRLILPRLLYVHAGALVLLAPLTAIAAFRARRAWAGCFMDMRLCEQASVSSPTDFVYDSGVTMHFNESLWDCMRDFTADSNSRAAAALQASALAALAAAAPLWLLLLPPSAAAAATCALCIALCIFGVLRMHWWAELAADSVAARDEDDQRATRCEHEPPLAGLPSKFNSCTGGTYACDGTIISYLLLCLLPVQLFFGSGHFCEFAGLQWTAAFVGFDESASTADAVRSGVLVAFNTFAPHAISVLLLAFAAGTEMQGQLALIDTAAANGHACSRPRRVARDHVWTTAGCFMPLPLCCSSDPERLAPDFGAVAAVAGLQPVELYKREIVNPGPVRKTLMRVLGLLGIQFEAFADDVVTAANTVGSSMDASRSSLQWHSVECAHTVLCTALLIRASTAALDLVCATSNAYIQRRHLMIWALFAPKWMFEVCFWGVTMAVLLFAAVWSDVCVTHTSPVATVRSMEQ